MFASSSPDGEWLVGFHAFPNLFVSGVSLHAAHVAALSALIGHVTLLMDDEFPLSEPVEAVQGVSSIILPSIVATRIALHNETIARRSSPEGRLRRVRGAAAAFALGPCSSASSCTSA